MQKSRLRPLFVVLALVAIVSVTGSTVRAQDPQPPNPVLGRTIILEGAPPQDAGGAGLDNTKFADDTFAEERAARERVQANIAKLRGEGVLGTPDAAAQVAFGWPLTTKLTDFGYDGISNFVDHDASFPNHLLDYNNGTRTYDLSSGYNHAGTDIFLWPFPWNKLDDGEVSIVAAAPGTIVDKQDGKPDHNCVLTNGGPANYVILQHADGSKSWYWHMKTGSVTTKAIGASVAAGEKIGIVGSSGNSTAPHLHFEVHNASDTLIDPWVGPGNPTTAISWWQSQRPYYDPAINKLTTGFDAPVNPDCSSATPNIETIFNPGSEIYFTTYYHDQVAHGQTQYKILRPDQSTFESWSYTNPDYYAASWWWWAYTIPSNEPLGKWTFRVTYQGKTYDQPFQICGTKPGKPKLVSPAKNGTAGKKAKLDWQDSACAKAYNVVVRQDSKTGAVAFQKNGLDESKVKAKKLVQGKTYFWRVTACREANCGSTANSAWRSFTVQ